MMLTQAKRWKGTESARSVQNEQEVLWHGAKVIVERRDQEDETIRNKKWKRAMVRTTWRFLAK